MTGAEILAALGSTANTTVGAAAKATPNIFGQLAGKPMDWGALLASKGAGQIGSGALNAWNAFQNNKAMDLNMDALKQNMSQSEIAFGRELKKDDNRMNAFSSYGV